MKFVLVAGARPNFMKVAPILRSLEDAGAKVHLVHTGQHYDAAMSTMFFDELGIRTPDTHLQVGSGSHAEVTARVMLAFEPVLLAEQPDAVIVVGDVNSTLACALVAAKLHIPVAHVEAGLRSGDRSMPEELNRLCTDQLSDWLFTTSEEANENLIREGYSEERIHLVGNVMIDTLLFNRHRVNPGTLDRFGVTRRNYVLLTLHRPSNVDVPKVLAGLLSVADQIGRDWPILFPVHPRTRERIADLHWTPGPGVRLLGPLGYMDFLALIDGAFAVLTDSGGIQEETTVLGVPCLTLRESTERPITVACGTNAIAGLDSRYILDTYEALQVNVRCLRPELWDGKAASRIQRVLGSSVSSIV